MSFLHPTNARPDGRKVRYGVIGVGWIAQADFMPAVEHTGNSELVALVTSDAEKAKALAEKYPSITHVVDNDRYEDLFRSGQIDAIYIATPNSQHTDLAVKALEAGIHVLCEKPMADSPEHCRQMIDAGKKSGAKLMIAYRLHFEEATIEALEIARTGKIGDPRIFSSIVTQQVAAEKLHHAATNYAGPLPEMGVYPINAARQLFQAMPTEVFAFSATKPEPRFEGIEEMVSFLLKFPDERLATITVSYNANPVSYYRVLGTAGDLAVVPGYAYRTGNTHELTVGQSKSTTSYAHVDQFGGETKYFSDCILDDRHPEPDGEEGLADMLVVRAVEESIASGKPVSVPALQRAQWPARSQVQKLPPVPPGKLVNAAAPGAAS